MKTPHQQIAERLAHIADHSTRIERANEYDIPDDIEEKVREAKKAAALDDDDDDFDDFELREKLAAEYRQTELAKLKDEAAALGVTVDPELLAALLPAIATTTAWCSSSYGC